MSKAHQSVVMTVQVGLTETERDGYEKKMYKAKRKETTVKVMLQKLVISDKEKWRNFVVMGVGKSVSVSKFVKRIQKGCLIN